MNQPIYINYNKVASYHDIKSKISPFDLIACRGGNLTSNLISAVQSQYLGIGAFSHVGMIVTNDILPSCAINGVNINLEPGHLYLFESAFTYGEAPDITTKSCKFGVQLRDLKEVIPQYSGDNKIAWCKLKANPFNRIENESDVELKCRQSIIAERFKGLFALYQGRMFDADLINLFGSIFPSLRIIRDGRDEVYKTLYNALNFCGVANVNSGPAGWQFCSELVANVYQAYNIIPNHIDPKNVVPVDFFGYDEDGLHALVEEPIFII